MSIDFYALRDMGTGRAARATDMSTSAVLVRFARWVRLLACLARLYGFARLVSGGWAVRGGSDAQRWARRLLAALDIEVRLRGHVPAPDAPLLIVANHISWLDSYALNTTTRARFVAKAEVASWPVIGAIARAFDTLFLRRGSGRAAARMADSVAAALLRGTPVGVFPEGTTSWGTRCCRSTPRCFRRRYGAAPGCNRSPCATAIATDGGRMRQRMSTTFRCSTRSGASPASRV